MGPLLGSWKLSVVLMVLAGLYYGFLAIWATSSPPHVVQNIASLLPFWLVYGLLLTNTAVCLWRRLPGLRRDLSASPTRGAENPDWERQLPGGADPRAVLLGMGFRARALAGGLFGLKRRWAALGTYLFHGAFFLLALGFLLTLAGRYEARAWAAVGEEYAGREEQLLSQSASGPFFAGPPEVAFRVEEIRPGFWMDQLLFTTLESRLTLLPGGFAATTRINRPLWVGPATFLRLSGFGYAPRYEIADSRGFVLESAIVKMNVFPPGQRDFLVPARFPFRVYCEVYPDFVEGEGAPATASLNLRNPALRIRVTRGKSTLAEGLLKAGEALEFEGLRLSFPEIRYWGEFTLLRDPGAPFLFAGFLIGFSGLLLKVRGRRVEVLWVTGPDGRGGSLKGWGCGRPLALSAGPDAREDGP